MTGMLTVGVIFGGQSGEHEVSIASAQSVVEALAQRYRVVPFYISKRGQWAGTRDAQQVLTQGKVYEPENGGFMAVYSDLLAVDVVFPVLHGPYGEDGRVQGLLEMLHKKYVGNGVLASAVGMDKIMMKAVFGQAGLPQVKYLTLLAEQWQREAIPWCEQIELELGYPCFVKPANLGSSVGISKVRDRQQLQLAVNHALEYDRRVIVEQGVRAREIECGVLGNEQLSTSCVGEVTYTSDFYDYETKYTAGKAKYIIPAVIPPEVAQAVQTMSIKAFQAIGGRGLGRVDFFYIEESATILVNEINTMPGFTKMSGYPKFWQASGLEFVDLCDRLVQLAFA
ncbi:MAG: D-alanine--D-alanine ligase family protein [Pseudanabaenaceae cyanobacterium]